MSNNHKEFYELRELVLRSLDGNSSKEDIDRLQVILRSDSRARLYYRSFLAMYSDLNVVIGAKEEQENTKDVYSPLFELAEQESHAPELVLEKPDNSIVEIATKSEIGTSKFNKFYRIYSVILSVAAVIMVVFIVYTNIFPAKPSVPTATVVSVSNAKWSENSVGFDEGERLNTYSELYSLKSGLVELLYDYGATVIIEGPADFNIDSEKILNLNEGRLYTSVNTDCTGFSVATPSSILVDIGTEFGVNVNSNGDSQLHVFKGEVVLNAGNSLKNKIKSKHVYAGQAAVVKKKDLSVESIPVSNSFVESMKEPMFFEGFENMALGPLLDQPGWKTNSVYDASPIIVSNGLVGVKSIRGVVMDKKIGGADYPLPEVIDLAAIDKPLFISIILQYNGNETNSDDKEIMLTLSEKINRNESSGYIEGLFNLDKGARIHYSKLDSFVREPATGLDGSIGKMSPGRLYLCVVKFMPQLSGNCTISLGYCDISSTIPDEESMPYSASVTIDPAELIAKDSSGRYLLDHIAVSIRTDSIVADNLMVSDMWSHIRLLAKE